MPVLRAALIIAKAPLQNAVTTAGRQIDQFVYELCGLTLEEIALVERFPSNSCSVMDPVAEARRGFQH